MGYTCGCGSSDDESPVCPHCGAPDADAGSSWASEPPPPPTPPPRVCRYCRRYLKPWEREENCSHKPRPQAQGCAAVLVVVAVSAGLGAMAFL